MIRAFFCFVTFFIVLNIFAQEKISIIKATSKVVDIKDGNHFRKGYWYLMPEKKPDLYYVELPEKENLITFKTDIDSITFGIRPNEEFNFIILLNNKDTCYTKVLSKYKHLLEYKSTVDFSKDTIPITVEENNKIYLHAKINNSQTLNFQFDLGASSILIKKASIKKVSMNFDETITIANSDGTHEVPYSSSNIVEIGKLKWSNVPIAITDNMTKIDDGIVGNLLFRNKVIEINYDKSIMIIHDTLPAIENDYTKHEIYLSDGVPYIKGSFIVNSKKKAGWYIFDTGAYTTILETDEIQESNKFQFELKKLFGMISRSDSLLVPRIEFGDYSFSNTNYEINSGIDHSAIGLLGNDILKRFNVILDNQNGFIYLKKNKFIDEPFVNPEYYLVRFFVLGIVVVLGIIIFFLYRQKKNNKKLKSALG